MAETVVTFPFAVGLSERIPRGRRETKKALVPFSKMRLKSDKQWLPRAASTTMMECQKFGSIVFW